MPQSGCSWCLFLTRTYQRIGCQGSKEDSLKIGSSTAGHMICFSWEEHPPLDQLSVSQSVATPKPTYSSQRLWSLHWHHCGSLPPRNIKGRHSMLQVEGNSCSLWMNDTSGVWFRLLHCCKFRYKTLNWTSAKTVKESEKTCSQLECHAPPSVTSQRNLLSTEKKKCRSNAYLIPHRPPCFNCLSS